MLWRVVAVAALLALASLGYAWWSRRQGMVQNVEIAGALTPADLGAPRGQRGTVVLFSTPMCAKCPPTKALVARVIADVEGVTQVEIDAAERLDLARRLGIMRTPTLLVLDAQGVAVARMDGAPHEAQVRQAVDALPLLGGYSI